MIKGKDAARDAIRASLYKALCYWGTLPEPEGDVPERYHRWENLGEIAERLLLDLGGVVCPDCNESDISFERTCHNSACQSYAETTTVYEGWK